MMARIVRHDGLAELAGTTRFIERIVCTFVPKNSPDRGPAMKIDDLVRFPAFVESEALPVPLIPIPDKMFRQ
jgi:hypothetical protein